MLETLDRFANLYWEHGLPREREPAHLDQLDVPPDTEVISADCHWSVCEDIWYENFPARLKDRAPRVWLDRGCWTLGFDGKSIVPPQILESVAEFDERPGSYQLAPRLDDMDREGVSQEVVFANLAYGLLKYEDYEVREWIWQIYNEYIADVGARSSGRFHGVGVVSNWWDPAKAGEAIEAIGRLGLKTFMLPQRPGKFTDGRDITYAHADLSPLWSAIEDSGLPVCFHIGESLFTSGPGGIGTMNLMQFAGFRGELGPLIYGGVFDRHPRLQVVFAEAGITWAANALQDAENLYAAYHGYTLFDQKLKLAPREYWQNNCYTTFITDPIGLGLLDYVGGPERVLWSSDYPHAESSWGFSRESMKSVVQLTSPEAARGILGGNAKAVFKLD